VNVKNISEFYIFGAGKLGQLWYDCWKEFYKILGFIDNDISKQDNGYLGLNVYSIDKIPTSNAIVVALGNKFSKSVITQLVAVGYQVNINLFTITDVSATIPDKRYIEYSYKHVFDEFPNLNNPKSFNEKLNWLKLNYRTPLFTTLSDKIASRKYVSNLIGEEYVIPILDIWSFPDEIDYDILPNKFVLQCNHDSGSFIICTDKLKFDKNNAKNRLIKCLQEDFSLRSREWGYKNVERKVFASKYIGDIDVDYRLFVFNGEVKLVECHIYAKKYHHEGVRLTNLYLPNWTFLNVQHGYNYDESYHIDKPSNFEEMIKIAKILAGNIPFIRVDFWYHNNKIIFNEFALYPNAGFGVIKPKEWDFTLGEWLKLPEKIVL
jgi:hypothetical protein